MDDDVIVLGLAGRGLFGSENATTVGNFIEQTGVTFPVLMSDDTYVEYGGDDDGISPYPLDVIIDRDGTITYLRREFDGDAMVAEVERLLAQ